LPHVRIDRSLHGAVVSREAAETIAILRERERASWQLQIEDEKERAAIAQAREQSATWWRDNAPWIVVGVGLISAAAGFVIGSQTAK
jgi:hypothetical protein